eukprot:830799-Pleurochrysis_carterae.AAC.1
MDMDLSVKATISSCCCERYNYNESAAANNFTSGFCDDQSKLKARAPPRPSMSALQSRTPLLGIPAANKAASSTSELVRGCLGILILASAARARVCRADLLRRKQWRRLRVCRGHYISAEGLECADGTGGPASLNQQGE